MFSIKCWQIEFITALYTWYRKELIHSPNIIAKEDSLNAIRNRSENLLVNSLKNIGYDEKS